MVALMQHFDIQTVTIHGHDIGFRMGGRGPVLLLVHGMARNSDTWLPVLPALSEHFTVLAPDLPGHGASAKPRTDYSLGAFANSLRDLLVSLGIERATLVGHSLGGGVVMQFAYQFPERCERMVLESSGGLGEEVNLLLRALTLPGAEYVFPLLCSNWIHDTVASAVGVLKHVGLRPNPNVVEMWDSYGSLADAQTRTAFLHTLRSVIDVAGQRVSAHDRLYLASMLPTLIIWGDHDRIIPASQAAATHAAIPDSRLELFAGVGHFPHCERPRQFAEVLTAFVQSTRPAAVSAERWQELLLAATL